MVVQSATRSFESLEVNIGSVERSRLKALHFRRNLAARSLLWASGSLAAVAATILGTRRTSMVLNASEIGTADIEDTRADLVRDQC